MSENTNVTENPTPRKTYVKLDPVEAKNRRIAAAHKRWATIKARKAANQPAPQA